MRTNLIKPFIIQAAKKLWERAGGNNSFPCDIERAVQLAFPIILVQLSPLSIKAIQEWLFTRKYTISIDLSDRLLHGLILFNNGMGVIFINGTDDIRDKRFSLAHEVSHFYLEYFLPREKAIKKFGPSIIEVFDGIREPTTHERIKGILLRTSQFPKAHILERRGNGMFDSYYNWSCENNADALAVELLAPTKEILKKFFKLQLQRTDYKESKSIFEVILYNDFLLPSSVAQQYSGRLSYFITGGNSIVDKLGLK